jgi:hypothetical protein
MKRRLKKRRFVCRADLLPNKVAKEERRFDSQYDMMRRQIEKNFPDPVERMRYINALIEGLSDQVEPNHEPEPEPDDGALPTNLSDFKVVETGKCNCGCNGEHVAQTE